MLVILVCMALTRWRGKRRELETDKLAASAEVSRDPESVSTFPSPPTSSDERIDEAERVRALLQTKAELKEDHARIESTIQAAKIRSM